MLAKHKVVGSIPITRSMKKPLRNRGLFHLSFLLGLEIPTGFSLWFRLGFTFPDGLLD
jgi:hypothetical protein